MGFRLNQLKPNQMGNCQRDHGDSLAHPGKSCTRTRSSEAPIEGALLRHHVAHALGPEAGLPPDLLHSNSSRLSRWYLF